MTVKNSNATDLRSIIVCIHGSASDGGQWRALRQALRGRCRVFTPDLVGYGTRTRLAAKRVCELMAKQASGSRLLKLVNLQHRSPLTDPNSVDPLSVDFVVPVVQPTADTAGPRCA